MKEETKIYLSFAVIFGTSIVLGFAGVYWVHKFLHYLMGG